MEFLGAFGLGFAVATIIWVLSILFLIKKMYMTYSETNRKKMAQTDELLKMIYGTQDPSLN